MMKRKLKRLFSLLLAGFLLLPLAMTAQAAASTAPHYLDIRVKYRDVKNQIQPVPNADICIYKVADAAVAGGQVSYTYTEAFAKCGLEAPKVETLNGQGDELARSYFDYIRSSDNALKFYSQGQTDSSGRFKLAPVDEALYLICQGTPTKVGETYLCFNPFLISIPMKNENAGGGLSYGITCSPKAEQVDAPIIVQVKKVWSGVDQSQWPASVKIQVTGKKGGEKIVLPQDELNAKNKWQVTYPNLSGDYSWSVVEIDPPSGYKVSYSSEKKGTTLILTVTNTKEFQKKPPILIQTGQLNWPVPVMVVLGLGLIGAGWGITHHGKKKQ